MGASDSIKKGYAGLIKGLTATSNSLSEFRLKHERRWKWKRYLQPGDDLDPLYEQELYTFWKPYYPDFIPLFHRVYSNRFGTRDVRYIPDDLFFTKIDPYFNNHYFYPGVDDKNYYSLWFPEVRQPVAVVRKINGFFYTSDYQLITAANAVDRCCSHQRLIIKPTVGTGGGVGIRFWEERDTRAVLQKLLTGEDSLNNLIIQEILVQHELLSRIHPSSINTVRTMSLLFQGQVHVLSSLLRMGIGGSRVDNVSAGGYFCGIQPSGRLKPEGFDPNLIGTDHHPQGFIFREGVIPSYDKITAIVRKFQARMGQFRLISWDFTVDEDGEPVLIEANLCDGAIDFHQICNGPIFGDLTEAVLDEVTSGRRLAEST